MTDLAPSDDISPPPLKGDVRYYPKIYGMALIISILTVLGIVAVFLFAGKELDRELTRWQDKLNLIADSRVADVGGWVQTNFKELGGLADNASLQLYLTDLQSMEDGKKTIEPAQLSYLRNLLTVTAQRAGFEQSGETLAGEVKANVKRVGNGGIAIIDGHGGLLTATANMPPLESALLERVSSVPKGEAALLDMQQNPLGQIQIGFVVPIFAIQGDRDASSQIGAIVGIRLVDEAFFNLLKHPGVTQSSLEASLVRQENENVLFLSPLSDNSAALTKRMNMDTEHLAAAFAITNPQQFVANLNDYGGKPVLATSRTVPGTPWTLLVEVDRSEALAESNKWRSSLVTIFLLVILCTIVTIIAVWRHSSSRKAYELSVRATKQAAQLAAQEKLLRLVTDNQNDPIYIVDREHRYWFANRKASEDVEMETGDMIGKTVENVLGASRARDVIDANKTAIRQHAPYSFAKRVGEGENARIVQSEHIPLAHIPVETLKDPTPGVLVVEQDITEAVSERERRMQIMNQTIETLVTIVDQRDPFAAHHSTHVARIARAIAEEMGLDAVLSDTAEIAGKLMNIGKIVVPTEILTKSKSLDDKEKKTVRESMSASAELLTGIDFDGPVVETLRQAQENWDGSGPLKLKEDKILVTAQIIGVANAFVGMLSPRSYRAAMSMDKAVRVLMEEIDRQFDRRIVIALVNYLDNRGGRKELEKLTAPPKKAANS